MNILVVGGGHLGRKIAQELDSNGHEVAIIEENEDKLSLLDPQFSGVTFLSFPMDISNLKNAGIENCDAVAVTTSDDNLNIAVGQIAKNIFGVKTVVSRISDPYREYIFESFGLQTVCPTNMATSAIISAMTSKSEEKEVSFGTNMVSFHICPVERQMVDKRLSDISGGENDVVFGVLRQDGRLLLNTSFNPYALQLGDSILLAEKVD